MQVYESDVARLEAIEEAGFLLGLQSDGDCPVCGAPIEAQKHDHALGEIEAARAAAEIEIAKIRAHQSELVDTITDTENELHKTGERSEEHTSELQSLMRISYAVFCLKKNTYNNKRNQDRTSVLEINISRPTTHHHN